MHRTSLLAKGALVAVAAGAIALGAVAPAMAAQAESARSSAYVANGRILGQDIVTLWQTQADRDVPSDAEGGDLTLGPIRLGAVQSQSSVDLATGTASARSSLANASFTLGDFGAFSASLSIDTIGAACQINPDGTFSATSSNPLVRLVVRPLVGPAQTLSIPFVRGVATLGFGGLNLGTIELGQTDTDISDGVVGATGARVTLLNVGPLQAGSITLGSATCGPVVPLAEVPAIDPAIATSVGALGLLAIGAHRLTIGRQRES